MRFGASAMVVTAALIAQGGCRRQPPSQPVRVSYVLGPAWESADHAWFYPRERFGGTMTGLAVPLACDPGQVTTDGEPCDPTLPQGAMQSLQLPVIVRVTNLENGARILVRADDRGPASPGRLIALNARARTLLGMATGASTRVGVDIDTVLSQAAIDGLPGAPHADIEAAPQLAVEEQPLGAPTARATVGQGGVRGETASPSVDATLRSQSVMRVPVEPTSLWVDEGVYSSGSIAREIASRAGGLARQDGAGRNGAFQVSSGPFDSVEAADAALKQARDGGITGARIVVR